MQYKLNIIKERMFLVTKQNHNHTFTVHLLITSITWEHFCCGLFQVHFWLMILPFKNNVRDLQIYVTILKFHQ